MSVPKPTACNPTDPPSAPAKRFVSRRSRAAAEVPTPADEHDVVVLDDNPSILTGLERLLTASGYRVRLHQDPVDFLKTGPPAGPACLLLDNHLEASMTGIQVHAEIIRRGWNLPTVFLTAHWSVHSIVAAVRAGADGFITKPYAPAELLKAVAEALQRAQAAHQLGLKKSAACALVANLTKRERQIACLVIEGKINKEIADDLGLALVTVKVHRARAMSKLGVTNAAELANLARVADMCS